MANNKPLICCVWCTGAPEQDPVHPGWIRRRCEHEINRSYPRHCARCIDNTAISLREWPYIGPMRGPPTCEYFKEAVAKASFPKNRLDFKA